MKFEFNFRVNFFFNLRYVIRIYYLRVSYLETIKKQDKLTKLKNWKSKFEKKKVDFDFVEITALVRRKGAQIH